MRFPDLICLGAQKSATTWLYDTMRKDDGVFVPPIKEVHYFSQLYNADARKYGPRHRRQQCSAIIDYINGLPSQSDQDQVLLTQLAHLNRSDVDDEWYGSIFALAKNDQVCVDICPSYMNMPQAAVQHVLRLNPSVRLLVLVRDPIERCWSQIRMHVSRGTLERNFDDLVDGTASCWSFLFYTDYAGSLVRWERYSAPGQLMTLLHDDVLTDPYRSLSRIYDFVGLRKPRRDPELGKEIFAGEKIEMPKNLRRKLLTELAPQYDFLMGIYPEAARSWLDRHHELLG
ncbi:MAG: sulfotransferase [Alphaproteobacteria bacterium]|nr:sulfotransferase [Alphaproteobacteria bacterium]